MSKTFSEKILRKSTKISMSVFPRLFLFYRVFRCFLAMGVQKHYKKRLTKKSCRKLFTKKSTKKSQTDFFSIFFYHVFGRFLVWGVKKPHTIFLKKAKSPCQKLFPRKFSENRQKLQYQFFLDLFCFIAWLGAS